MQPTILLVEDNEMVMEMIRDLLECAGYNVISTYLPEVALEYVQRGEKTINLLLSDVIMPQMNGPELYSKIRMTRKDIPALFMSGYSSEVINSTVPGDNSMVIQKPFKADQLIAGIRSMLTKSAGCP